MVYIFLYLSGIVLANLSVAHFGPSSAVINAFLFIGLDLTVRDSLHEAWKGNNLWGKMAGLIATGSVITWLLNRGAGSVAFASLMAFILASLVDTVAFHVMHKRSRWVRVNVSNVAAAMVDSLVFPTLAFGALLLPIVLGQFLAKVAGGVLWSALLSLLRNRTGTVAVIQGE